MSVQRGSPLWTETPLDRDPLGQRTPLPKEHGTSQEVTSYTPATDISGGHCSGWYASYWNAFLLLYYIKGHSIPNMADIYIRETHCLKLPSSQKRKRKQKQMSDVLSYFHICIVCFCLGPWTLSWHWSYPLNFPSVDINVRHYCHVFVRDQ